MTAELFVRSRDAPAAIDKEPTTLVPAALLGVPLALIFAEPAATFSPAARTLFRICTLPAPALVIVLLVAVRLETRTKPVPEAVMIVVLSLRLSGAAMV